MAENRELALVLKLVADAFQKELRNSQAAENFIIHAPCTLVLPLLK
jgi:hypothetical protein